MQEQVMRVVLQKDQITAQAGNENFSVQLLPGIDNPAEKLQEILLALAADGWQVARQERNTFVLKRKR